MAYGVTITLTNIGSLAGPFDLYSNLDNYTTPFETNVPATSFVTGYYTQSFPYGTTIIQVKSEGECINAINLEIIGLPTFTPTPTNTSTPTPSVTPNPAVTNTQTTTPSVTPSNAPVCPEQLIITNSNNPDIIDATYTRSHINSGGTFDYGYNKESGGTDSIIYGIAPDSRNYPIFQYYDGVDYTTIYRRFDEYNENLGWYSQTQSTNILTGATFTEDMIGFSTGDTLFNGVYYPPQSQMQFGLEAIITYPTICPTPTQTPSNTQTQTPTKTPTQTPTNTPSPTTPSYYKLDACTGGFGTLYTSIFPPLANQRYYDYVSGVYYVWDNTFTNTPGTIGATLQLVAGQTGCP